MGVRLAEPVAQKLGDEPVGAVPDRVNDSLRLGSFGTLTL